MKKLNTNQRKERAVGNMYAYPAAEKSIVRNKANYYVGMD